MPNLSRLALLNSGCAEALDFPGTPCPENRDFWGTARCPKTFLTRTNVRLADFLQGFFHQIGNLGRAIGHGHLCCLKSSEFALEGANLGT